MTDQAGASSAEGGVERAKAHLATCMERDDFPSHNCACDCGDVSELLAQLADSQAEVKRMSNEVARLTGVADGWKRGSELHEQARRELQAEVQRLTEDLEKARGQWDSWQMHCEFAEQERDEARAEADRLRTPREECVTDLVVVDKFGYRWARVHLTPEQGTAMRNAPRGTIALDKHRPPLGEGGEATGVER